MSFVLGAHEVRQRWRCFTCLRGGRGNYNQMSVCCALLMPHSFRRIYENTGDDVFCSVGNKAVGY